MDDGGEDDENLLTDSHDRGRREAERRMARRKKKASDALSLSKTASTSYFDASTSKPSQTENKSPSFRSDAGSHGQNARTRGRGPMLNLTTEEVEARLEKARMEEEEIQYNDNHNEIY